METGRVSIDSQILTDIADSIRSKNGETSHYYPQNMAGKIDNILVPSGTVEITSNGTYDVTQYASAEVNTPGITPTGTINITQNGTTDVTNYASASVNVPSNPLEFYNGTIVRGSSYVNNPSGILKSIVNAGTLTTNDTSLEYAFQRAINLTSVNIIINTNVTSMEKCFDFCSSLTNVSFSGTFNNLANCANAFSNCSSLVSAPDFNVSKVTTARNMFSGCTSLVNVPNYNFSSLFTECYNMFKDCSQLVTAPTITMDSVTYMNEMFNGCTSLVNVPQYNLSSMANANLMGDVFKNCSSLSNDSLSNIMNSLAGSSINSGTMTLAKIGLNSTQATYCASLPIWSTLTSAGWATGY